MQGAVQTLLAANFVSGLVKLAKSESDNCKEQVCAHSCTKCRRLMMLQVARVFLAMIEDPKNRGTVIQQGGAKALLPLAREGTAKGKSC